MKFEVGDRVAVAVSGWGFGDTSVGKHLTIKAVSDNKYFKSEGCQVVEKIGDNKDTRWYGVKSFLLIEKAYVPKNNNVKMITTFVPTWAKWMAMDKQGYWIVLSKKPIANTDGHWVSRAKIEKVGRCNPKDITVDWKETLHKI